MKISALTLAKLQSTISALIVSAGASLAQAPVPPPPGAPVPPAPPSAVTPGTGTGTLTPAPIDPPIQAPANPPVVPGTPGDPATTAPGTPAGPGGADAAGVRVSEFQGDDAALVLRTLARQAKMNVVVSPKVTGQITLRVENKTPAEVIRIICQANGLTIDDIDGVFYVKTLEEKQAEPTKPMNYTFSYAQAKDIAPLIKTQFNLGGDPQVDTRTNTIFLRVGDSVHESVQKFLAMVDSPTKQVMIEARLVEVNANPKQSYGLNWGGVVGSSSTPMQFKYGGSDTSGAVPTSSKGTYQLNDFLRNGNNLKSIASSVAGQYAILSVQQMSMTMRLLNEDSDAEFLANPRIVASNNQKATIKITRNQPVPQLNFNEQTAQAVFGGFQDKEFGNTLTVTPSINKDHCVSLMVQPEISNKVGDATFTFSGATVASPIIDKRTFDSNVLIKSGDTLAIGGLLQDEVTKSKTKVPIAGDIPLFGHLFTEKMNSRIKRNLLVFVTPTIINQGYGTGLESQITGLKNTGNEFADPNGWRNNARGAFPLKKKIEKPLAAEYPAPVKSRSAATKYKVNAAALE